MKFSRERRSVLFSAKNDCCNLFSSNVVVVMVETEKKNARGESDGAQA